MSIDFISRMIGMVIGALVGTRVGLSVAPALSLPQEAAGLIFALIGVLFGLILTPWVTIRPVRILSRLINDMPVEILLMTLVGTLIGLLIGLLAAYPLSLLSGAVGTVLPALVLALAVYLLTTIFNRRAREILTAFGSLSPAVALGQGGGDTQYVLDTSVLIDGRVVDIAKSGFIPGMLIVPRFVISELHRVADSSDAQRRNRGRRGLDKLNELKRETGVAFKIVEDDFENIPEVDDKLIALALQLGAPILTMDFPMNQVARAQGVTVLNINALANAVRSIYIPGETFALRVIQEGKENNQGVGYLDDGTMVIVENGKPYIDRTVYVEVTKLINKDTGRIIFAVPDDPSKKVRQAAVPE